MPKTFMQIASEAMAHVPSRLIRRAGLAAILGAAIWWTSWILNSFTKDGSVAVLGLSERGWRTVANLALLSFTGGLAGITAAHASRAGKVAFVGFLTTLLGLVAMLAGNVIEFWVAADPGGFMTLVGLLVQQVDGRPREDHRHLVLARDHAERDPHRLVRAMGLARIDGDQDENGLVVGHGGRAVSSAR